MAMAAKANSDIGSKPSRKSTTSGSVGSHRSFQPVLPCGNKLLQQRWDKTYYDEHRRLVKTAKPMVDTRAPQVRPHVTSKWKKRQLERERAEVIDRDNLTLLKKMQQIMKTEGRVDHKNTYKHHSLNQLQRQREMERVAKENKEMLKRLENVEPIYKVSDWVEDWRRKEEIAGMITAYPDHFQAISSFKAKQSSTSNPGTSDRRKEQNETETDESADGGEIDDDKSQDKTAVTDDDSKLSTKDSEEDRTEQ